MKPQIMIGPGGTVLPPGFPVKHQTVVYVGYIVPIKIKRPKTESKN